MTIDAVLTPCSARKQKLSGQVLDALQHPAGTQSEVARAWLAALNASKGQVKARDLYQGASFNRLRTVASSLGAPLFVISAGLGLVAGAALVPVYDLTLSPSAPTRIQSRIRDRFDPAAWWQQVQGGPFASPMSVITAGEGCILVALTKPYAQLVGPALAQLPARAIERLRIFGATDASLPAVLRPQVMPYDARLDVVSPGTRMDYPSRALAHFAKLVVAQPMQTAAADAALVSTALASTPAPPSSLRPKVSDDQLLEHIQKLVQRGVPPTRALRELRQEMGIACEQGRFRRLYTSVSA